MSAIRLVTSPDTERPRLGSLLLRSGRLSPEQLETALTAAVGTRERLGQAIVRLGFLTEEDIAKALAEQFAVPFADPSAARPDPAAVALLPEDVARRHCALPIRLVGEHAAVVAVADPTDADGLAQLQRSMGRRLELVVAERSAIDYAFLHAYRRQAPGEATQLLAPAPPPDSQELPGDLVRLVERLVVAVEDVASELRCLRKRRELSS